MASVAGRVMVFHDDSSGLIDPFHAFILDPVPYPRVKRHE
jgi:hypothetical protein